MGNFLRPGGARDSVRDWAMKIIVTNYYADNEIVSRDVQFSVPCGVWSVSQAEAFCRELVRQVAEGNAKTPDRRTDSPGQEYTAENPQYAGNQKSRGSRGSALGKAHTRRRREKRRQRREARRSG